MNPASPPRPGALRPSGLFAPALALALALAGCASGLATGPVERPERYPDRTTAEAAWASYLWAWREGDVGGLQATTGWRLRNDLELQLEKNGAEATSAWYRRDAEGLQVDAARWVERGERLAYVRVRLSRAGADPRELDFSLVARSDGWVVTGAKPAIQ